MTCQWLPEHFAERVDISDMLIMHSFKEQSMTYERGDILHIES